MSHALCRGGRRSCLATLRTTRLRPAVATSAPSTYSTPSIYLLRESSSPGRLREPARSICVAELSEYQPRESKSGAEGGRTLRTAVRDCLVTLRSGSAFH